jgi:lipopolysaccharide transport system permease protein
MMALEFIVIVAFFVGMQFIPPLTGLMVIPFLAILFFLTLSVSMMLSVLNVHFRDIGVLWTVVLQIGFFAAPIIYKIDFLPEKIQQIILINPVAHIIEAVHNLLLYAIIPTAESVSYMIGFTIVMFVIGMIVFRHFNPRIAEYL